MNLRVNVPDSLESALKAQAAAAGQDVETFVAETLRLALSAEVAEEVSPVLSDEQFQAKLQRIIDRHPRGIVVIDDSRESIYAGRGE